MRLQASKKIISVPKWTQEGAISALVPGENCTFERITDPKWPGFQFTLDSKEYLGFYPAKTLGSGAYHTVKDLCVFFSHDASVSQDWVLRTSETPLDDIVEARLKASQFASEDRILKSISHPNIVQKVFGMQCREGKNWLTMGVYEKVYGLDLHDIFKSKPKTAPELELRLKQVRHVGKQLAGVFQFLHGLGIAYRDLKPNNVMVGALNWTKEGSLPDDFSRWVVKLIDFETAATAEHKDDRLARTEIAGCADYLAPEVLSRRTRIQTEDGDVWALGVTMAEILTGKGFSVAVDKWDEGKLSKTKKISRLKKEDVDGVLQLMTRQYSSRGVTGIPMDLLKGMIHPKLRGRFFMDDVVDHPFFTGLEKKEAAALSDSDSDSDIDSDADVDEADQETTIEQ